MMTFRIFGFVAALLVMSCAVASACPGGYVQCGGACRPR